MKATTSKKKTKVGDEEGAKKRKQKKKKDPNAPKKAMSGYMFFLQNEREVSLAPRRDELMSDNVVSFYDIPVL